MIRILLILSLISPALAQAEAPTQIAWDADTLNFVKKGDIKRGQELAQSCAGCHGEKGVSEVAEFPTLAGQVANYSYKQLRDYANGSRTHPLMSSIAQGLSELDSADLAVWYESLSLPVHKGAKKDLEVAENLVEKGDGKRIIPPCFACHGANGEGQKMDIPALAGQQAEYFEKTFLEYKKGERHNDIYSRMRLIAQQLSDNEIKALAQYYQQFR